MKPVGDLLIRQTLEIAQFFNLVLWFRDAIDRFAQMRMFHWIILR
jgi:hypothetical protein